MRFILLLFICTSFILVSSCKSQIEINSAEKEADELARNVNSQNMNVLSEWRSLTTLYNSRNDKSLELLKIIESTLGTYDSRMLNKLLKEAKEVKNIDDIIIDETKFVSYSKLNEEIVNQISKILIFAENKKIKSSSFYDVQAEIEGLENSISLKRRDYNLKVQGYNKKVENANNVFIVKYPHLIEKCYFKPKPGSDARPKVNF
jgi:LemA protein